MGTNFYIIDKDQEYSEGRHIGKRSAAGWYCWDCGTTLCIVTGKQHYRIVC